MSGTAESIPENHWRNRGLCAGHPERECWFPEEYSGAAAARAIAICQACPVRVECLEFAIKTRQSEGVWGGTTPYKRRRIVQERRQASRAN